MSAHGGTGRESVADVHPVPPAADRRSGHRQHRRLQSDDPQDPPGANLPSVQAGTPYQIIGYNNSVADFSDVVFPVIGEDSTRQCAICHQSDTGATQADAWFTKPSRVACGSCHDNVNFATGEGHAGLPQVSDNQCTNCHTPQGELEFDISIKGAHVQPTQSALLPGLDVKLLEVADGTAGSHPTVTFTATDKNGDPVDVNSISRLLLGLDGPTTDYPMEPIQEDATKATPSSDNRWMYTFTAGDPGRRDRFLGGRRRGPSRRNAVSRHRDRARRGPRLHPERRNLLLGGRQ